MKIDTKTYVPISLVSRKTGISRQWINTKANQGIIRTRKPFEHSNLILYNLTDAMKHFDILDTK